MLLALRRWGRWGCSLLGMWRHYGTLWTNTLGQRSRDLQRPLSCRWVSMSVSLHQNLSWGNKHLDDLWSRKNAKVSELSFQEWWRGGAEDTGAHPDHAWTICCSPLGGKGTLSRHEWCALDAQLTHIRHRVVERTWVGVQEHFNNTKETMVNFRRTRPNLTTPSSWWGTLQTTLTGSFALLGTIKNLLIRSISVWFGSCKASDWKPLQSGKHR